MWQRKHLAAEHKADPGKQRGGIAASFLLGKKEDADSANKDPENDLPLDCQDTGTGDETQKEVGREEHRIDVMLDKRISVIHERVPEWQACCLQTVTLVIEERCETGEEILAGKYE